MNAGNCKIHLLQRVRLCVINHRQELDQQISDLASEVARVKAERERWERRVALLKADRIDPDMLDERARQLLNFLDPHEVTIVVKHR